MSQVDREGRLADPAGTGDRHDRRRCHAPAGVAVVAEHRHKLGELAGPAGEPADAGRQLPRDRCRGDRRARRLQLRVGREDPPVQLVQRPARCHTQLVGQEPAHGPERVERLGLPAGPVEREHPVPPQPFPRYPLAHQVPQLGRQLVVLPEVQAGLHEALGDGQPAFLQAGQPRVRVRVERDVLQRHAPPQRHAPCQQLRARGGIAVAQCPLAAGREVLEDQQVQLVRGYQQPVPGGLADEPGRGPGQPERAAQRRHVGAQRARRGRRRGVAPHHVDQAADAHRPVGVEQQGGQHRALLGRADPHELAVSPADLERAQNPEQHPLSPNAEQ